VRAGDIITYAEMCEAEQLGQQQGGMRFRSPPGHGVILMSLRPNAPYADEVGPNGMLIYEGHNARRAPTVDPRRVDQPRYSAARRPTENGKFADWTDRYKRGDVPPARFHVYEKLQKGIWTFRGAFLLRDYRVVRSDSRWVFKFILEPTVTDSEPVEDEAFDSQSSNPRQIPTWVKQFVYKRDHGRCVICGESNQLHFDHDLPFSKGGTSALPENIRLLCARHNLAKGARIE
jgi:hypothetical protein